MAHAAPTSGDRAAPGAAGSDALFPYVRILDLRPTQLAVGYREVQRKRLRLREAASRGLPASKTIPVVQGPGDRLHILDGHHLARALFEEGARQIAVNVVADLSPLSFGAFWRTCEERGWSNTFDTAGRRQPMWALPATVMELKDDPFRSLAGDLRRAGGYAKTSAPHSEFRWADFLRARIALEAGEAGFDAALSPALGLASGPEAAHLPGWRPAARGATPPRPDLAMSSAGLA